MGMRGHGTGGRGGGWSGMRSMRQDRAVLEHRVKKGTARRMLTFAVPYRKILAIFIPVVIVDAAVGAVTPLILRAIINNGILKHDADLVIWLSVLVAVLAIVGCRPCRSPSAASRPTSASASSTTCAPRCSATSSACRSPSSPGPRPAPWSAGSTTTSSAPNRPSPTCSPTSSATSSPWSSSSPPCSSSAGRSPWPPSSWCRCSSSRPASSANASAR